MRLFRAQDDLPAVPVHEPKDEEVEGLILVLSQLSNSEPVAQREKPKREKVALEA